MKKLYSMFAVTLMAVVLNGCAALGIATPETFNQQLAVGYGTVTQVRETATQLIQQKKITVEDAMNVQMSAEAARAGLDTARTLNNAGATTQANAKLQAVRTVLQSLTTYLASRQTQ